MSRQVLARIFTIYFTLCIMLVHQSQAFESRRLVNLYTAQGCAKEAIEKGKTYTYVKEYDSYCIVNNNIILKSRTTKEECEQELKYECKIKDLEYCGNLNEDKCEYKNSICTLTRDGKEYLVEKTIDNKSINSEIECIGYLINGECHYTEDIWQNLQKNCKGTPQFIEGMGFCVIAQNETCDTNETYQKINFEGKEYGVCNKPDPIINDTDNYTSNYENYTNLTKQNNIRIDFYSIETINTYIISTFLGRNLNTGASLKLNYKLTGVNIISSSNSLAILKKTNDIDIDSFEVYDYDSGYKMYAYECEDDDNYYCVSIYKPQINLLIKFIDSKKLDSVFQGLNNIVASEIKELNNSQLYSYSNIFSNCIHLGNITYYPASTYSEKDLQTIKKVIASDNANVNFQVYEKNANEADNEQLVSDPNPYTDSDSDVESLSEDFNSNSGNFISIRIFLLFCISILF